jgi:hypothetical protein
MHITKFKEKFIIVLSTLCFQFLIGQQNYADYTSAYTGTSYTIQVGGDGELYMDLMSFDAGGSKVGLIMKRKRIDEFNNCLDSALAKYNSWKNVAINNNVKDFAKSIDCSCKSEAYFKYGDWQFDNFVQPTFEFKVVESNGKVWHLLIVRTGKLVSNSNQYMDHDGGAIVFSSSEEMVNFMNYIKIESVDLFLSKKPKTEELFK